MKKVTLILMVLLNSIVLTGCTDQLEELEEIKNEQQQIKVIEPDETGEPGGGIPEEEG